jgi:hypothetical protein
LCHRDNRKRSERCLRKNHKIKWKTSATTGSSQHVTVWVQMVSLGNIYKRSEQNNLLNLTDSGSSTLCGHK